MSEWSDTAVSPQKMWEELKKEDPLLDQNKFRASDGWNWDIARLNNAYNEICMKKQQVIDQQMKTNSINKAYQQQQEEWNKNVKELETQAELLKNKIIANTVNLSGFKTGLFLFWAPGILQLLILFSIASSDNTVILMDRLFSNIVLLMMLTVISWISIPIMTKTLADAITVLDNRTTK